MRPLRLISARPRRRRLLGAGLLLLLCIVLPLGAHAYSSQAGATRALGSRAGNTTTGAAQHASINEDVAAGALTGRHYSLTVCSFALHLADVSRLPLLAWQLAQISDALLIVTPHKRPDLRPEWGWRLVDEFVRDRVRARVYLSHRDGEGE